MIETKIIKIKDSNENFCKESVLRDVKYFIQDNKIKKEDIVEYKTQHDSNITRHGKIYCYEVILSYWCE